MVCELKQIEFVGEVWARNMSIIVNCLIGLIENGLSMNDLSWLGRWIINDCLSGGAIAEA